LSRRKSVHELQQNGSWVHLSKEEQAKRLALENRRLNMPVGLNQLEVIVFEKVCNHLEEGGGCLLPSDNPAIVEMVRAINDRNWPRADEIRDSILLRQQVAVEVKKQEPAPPPRVVPDAAIVAKAYAVDVISGTIVAGKLARQAAKRFLDDLATGSERGLTFDTSSAQRCANYITGLGLDLLPWQTFCLANIFGWKKANGLRRFREAFILLAKKNGKTELAAAIALYCADTVAGDGEPRSNVFVAATTRYQSSSLCYKAALRLRNATPSLAARTHAWKSKSNIVFDDTEDSFFEPLAANSEKLNGQSMAVGILDELGDHPTSDLYSVFTSSSTGRKQPLTISITTAGMSREQIAWEVRGRATQALEGSSPTEAEAFFAFICELDEGDDPENEKNWIKANPSLGVLVPIDNIRNLLQSARAIPSTMTAFKRYNLNTWAETSEQAWIRFDDLTRQGNAYLTPDEKEIGVDKRIAAALSRKLPPVYDTAALAKMPTPELMALQRRQSLTRPFAGLDGAIRGDLFVLSWLYAPATSADPFEVFFRVWCPEESIERRSREQRVPYQIWRDQKFIVATPGNTMDFDRIENEILDLHKIYNFAELGFDRSCISQMAQRLDKSGIKMVDIKQGYALSSAIQHVEKLIIERRFCCWGQPVWNWCASNVQIQTGYKGEVQLNKAKAREKIDAAAAACFAMQVWLEQPQQATNAATNANKYEVKTI
jgi:phage terminase large subunit-like protein